NNARQQPRLCIDLNVEYRAEDDDALNDGCSTSQIRVISDSAQTSFSMSHSVPQAQTSLRAPRAQAMDAGKMLVSIENANQRISVTSSLPSARSSEVRCERPDSASSRLSFASSSEAHAGQSGETSERRIPENASRINKMRYPVPKELRKPGETDETLISKRVLLERRLVPVPEALRFEGETDQTRISISALSKRRRAEMRYPVPKELRKPGETDETLISKAVLLSRKLVPIPEALRLAGETDQTRISRQALYKRKFVPVPESLRRPGDAPGKLISQNRLGNLRWVPVPPELRHQDETDDTRIRFSALHYRRKLVSVPEALRDPGETEDTQIFKQTLQNRKRQRAAEQNSAEIKKSKRTE
ncbi:MAG: hypothetical protein P8104_06420, partial [Gammaproteobacteria bacterium]